MKPKALMTVVVLLTLLPAGAASAGVAEVASRAGIAESTRTFSVDTVDFDKDKRDDIFLVRHNPDPGPGRFPFASLYRNNGNGFSDFRPGEFGHSDKHGCTWGDSNSDGQPDLFCAIGFSQFAENELWIQNDDHSFSDQAQSLGLHQDTHGRYRYATFIHANNDNRPDLYVARLKASCGCGLYDGDNFPNELWINQGGSYREAPEFGLSVPIGATKDTNSCAQAVDYDRDGDQDLMVCGEKSLYLYRNNGGTGFTDVTSQHGIGVKAFDARLIDLNRDGRRDLVTLTRSRLTIRYGTASGWGRVGYSMNVTAGEALAFGKFNPGSRMDIYVLNSRGNDRTDDPDAILLNKGKRRFRKKVIGGTSGSGDDVATLDYDGNGRADFVVTNGDRKEAGPVQLFTWVKRRARA